MQRLQRRAQKAVAHARRQAQVRNERSSRRVQLQKDAKLAEHALIRRQIADEAKQRLYEKYYLGALAPRRPENKDEDNKELEPQHYINPQLANKRHKARTGRKQVADRAPLRKPFEQSYRVGDRVCCVASKGSARRYKGYISTVTEVRSGQRSCLVEGLNLRPRDQGQYDRDPQAADYIQYPIPIAFLRPVKTLYNPSTGKLEDVIIGLDASQRSHAQSPIVDPLKPFSAEAAEQAQAAKRQRIEEKRQAKEERYKKQEDERKKRDEKSNEIDTARLETESRTWTPTLLRAPLPDGVLDELRGKYSRFRRRHDPEYVAKLEEKERKQLARQDYLEGEGGMLSSALADLSLKNQRDKQAEGDSRDSIPETLLEQIGRRMVERRATSTASISSEHGLAAEAQARGIPVGVAAAAWERDRKVRRRLGRAKSVEYWPRRGHPVKRVGKAQVPVEVLAAEEGEGVDTLDSKSMQ